MKPLYMVGHPSFGRQFFSVTQHSAINSVAKDFEVASMTRKIILPGDSHDKILTRPRFIEQFLKDWLTEKQMNGMKPWFLEMFDAFSTDLLLHAQKVGVEKLLLQKFDENIDFLKTLNRTNYPLTIVSKKPVRSEITLMEVEGDLASEAKLLPISQVKLETEQNVSE